jgi:hypothetical protein
MLGTVAAAAAALAVVTAALACGRPAETPGVATAATGTGTPTPSGTADEIARFVEGRRAWVRCLREHGFPNVPDPDAKGQVQLDSDTIGIQDKRDGPWLAAQKACMSLLKEVPAVLQPTRDPLTAEQIQWNRDYAKCMRANGYPGYPDPGPDGTWDNAAFPTGTVTRQEDEAMGRALQICDPVMSGRPTTSYDPRHTAQG